MEGGCEAAQETLCKCHLRLHAFNLLVPYAIASATDRGQGRDTTQNAHCRMIDAANKRPSGSTTAASKSAKARVRSATACTIGRWVATKLKDTSDTSSRYRAWARKPKAFTACNEKVEAAIHRP